MGCNHELDKAQGTPLYTFSYGLHFTSELRTVMAYPKAGQASTRVPFFSGPDVLYQGTTPTGNVNANNGKRERICAGSALTALRVPLPNSAHHPMLGVDV